MQARELMQSDPEVVTPRDSVAKAARLMRGRGVAVLAVVEDRSDRKALGAVADRQLLLDCVAAGHEPRRCPIWNHVRDDVARVTPDQEIGSDAATDSPIDRRPVLVVDDGGRLLGVIESQALARR